MCCFDKTGLDIFYRFLFRQKLYMLLIFMHVCIIIFCLYTKQIIKCALLDCCAYKEYCKNCLQAVAGILTDGCILG